MKKLMVVRCDAIRPVSKGLFAVSHGLSIPRWPELDEIAHVVRCQNPLGHAEARHLGSEADLGHHTFEWGPS